MRSARPYWATSSTPPSGTRGSMREAATTAKCECTCAPMPSWCVVQCSTPGRTSCISGARPPGAGGPPGGYRAAAAAPSSIGRLSSDVDQALALYAAGFFPMDDLDEAFGPLPFYAAEDRALFELDAGTRAHVRRRVRRSLRAGEGWTLRMDTAFDTVLGACARPREED